MTEENPRDELARRLRDMLDEAGLSTVRTAELLKARGVKASQSKVSRALTGRTPADPEFVAQLCATAQREGHPITDRQRDDLTRLAEQVKKAARRLVMGRDPAAAQKRIARFTEKASLIRSFGASGFDGLVQTEPYMREVMRGRPNAEMALSTRLAYQGLLDDLDRAFVFLMPEGGLGFPGLLPPAGMADQIDRVVDASYRTNVRVGIIPWGAPCPVWPLHSWSLYDDDLVVTGGASFALDLTDPDDVNAYADLTDTLEGVAVYGGRARALLKGAADRYRS